MNILIPDSWLREHLQSNAKKQDIQKYLSLCGPSVERIIEKVTSNRKKEAIYDIEVTSNRVDSMSIRGIAREAATILNRSGIPSQLKVLKLPEIKKDPSVNLALPEIIYQTDQLKRVMAVVLDQLKNPNSPDFMRQRLEQVKINSHQSIIDISNYITHELGHPCHVFDYDKIMASGGKIIIREAKVKEKLVTLDGETYQTVGGEIVFADLNNQIIDLPGIKGAANSAVDENTTRLLFWIESIDAKKVRFASMTHAIRTVAAQLNEKNVDPHLAAIVLRYGVSLYKKICGAKVASELYDYFPNRSLASKVQVSAKQIQDYLGIELKSREVLSILRDLDFEVEERKNSDPKKWFFIAKAPSFRQDIQIPADLIEEIARIYGYHNLPSQLMTGPLPLETAENNHFRLEQQVKTFLANLGWQEIYSYSLVSEELLKETSFPVEEHLSLLNPLKEENRYLRRSLLPSLHEIFKNHPQEKELSLFEMAFVYEPQKNNLPEQKLYLALLSKKSYRQVRGDLEALLRRLFILDEKSHLEVFEELHVTEKSTLLQQKASLRFYKGKKRYDLAEIQVYKNGEIGIEIEWKIITELAQKYPHYQKIINTAAISEDFTFTLKDNTRVGDFIYQLKSTDARIKEMELQSIYQKNYSFTLVFQDPSDNISSDVVEKIRKKIIQKAEAEFQAQLVGKV